MNAVRKVPERISLTLFEPTDAEDAEQKLRAGFLGAPRKKKRVATIPDSQWVIAVREMRAMVTSGDWTPAVPRHFVALWAMLHEHVYEVPPLDLTPAERLHAAGAALRMLNAHFGNDGDDLASFLLWTWKREAGREKWRRDNDRPGARIGWRAQFGGGILTEWRLDHTRKNKP